MSLPRERTVAFIVARLSSSRFPAKQLKMLGDKPLLSWTVSHLKASKEIDQIVIATVAEQANTPLREFADQHGIACFWYEGEVNQVTTRLCAAADKFDAEICVLISGDCPLVDGGCIDELIAQFRQNLKKDFIVIPHLDNNNQCMLQGVLIARKSAWQRAEAISSTPELKEHHFPALILNPQLFSPFACIVSKDFYSQYHRLSIDTWADYTFFLEVYLRLSRSSLAFSLQNTINLLQRHPEIRNINRHVHQRRLKEDIPIIFFIAFSPDPASVDNVFFSLRNIEIGNQVIERRGWPVHFITNDAKTHRELAFKGIRSSLIPQDLGLQGYCNTVASSFHLIIDNSQIQHSSAMISHLISSATSSIIIGEGYNSQGKNILRLIPWPEFPRGYLNESPYPAIIAGFIESHLQPAILQ